MVGDEHLRDGATLFERHFRDARSVVHLALAGAPRGHSSAWMPAHGDDVMPGCEETLDEVITCIECATDRRTTHMREQWLRRDEGA